MRVDHSKIDKKTTNWKCSESPTGAHHYLLDGNNYGECKFCGKGKQFPMPRNRISERKPTD